MEPRGKGASRRGPGRCRPRCRPRCRLSRTSARASATPARDRAATRPQAKRNGAPRMLVESRKTRRLVEGRVPRADGCERWLCSSASWARPAPLARSELSPTPREASSRCGMARPARPNGLVRTQPEPAARHNPLVFAPVGCTPWAVGVDRSETPRPRPAPPMQGRVPSRRGQARPGLHLIG